MVDVPRGDQDVVEEHVVHLIILWDKLIIDDLLLEHRYVLVAQEQVVDGRDDLVHDHIPEDCTYKRCKILVVLLLFIGHLVIGDIVVDVADLDDLTFELLFLLGVAVFYDLHSKEVVLELKWKVLVFQATY